MATTLFDKCREGMPPVPQGATWTEVVLERIGGECHLQRIVVYARTDSGALREAPHVRIWCEDVDQAPWHRLPDDLDLDVPTPAAIGAQVRLLREHRDLFGYYVVKQQRNWLTSADVTRVEWALEGTASRTATR